MASSDEEEYEEVEVEEEIEVEEEDDDEEFEYEEVIEEVEVEEDDDPEEPEEEEEDPEEPDEEDEDPEEKEDDDPEEEVQETVEEKAKEGEIAVEDDDDEEEYEEIEVEEEVEVEVTDDECDSEIAERMALWKEVKAGDISGVDLFDKPVAVVELAVASTVESAVASTVEDDHNLDARLSVELKRDEISDCPDRGKSESTCDVHVVKAAGSALGSRSPDKQAKQPMKGKAVPFTDDGPSKNLKLSNLQADFQVFESESVKDKDQVEQIIPVAYPLAVNPGQVDQIMAVSTPEKQVLPTPAATNDQLFITSATEEGKFPDHGANLYLQSSKEMEEEQSRYRTSQVRPRSMSPGAESEGKNKRPAIVCEYFAKGWCIRGRKCRFIHERAQVEYAKGQEGDILCNRSAFQFDKGSGDVADASNAIACDQSDATMTNSNDSILDHSTGRHYAKERGKGIIKDKCDMSEEFSYPLLSCSQRLTSYSDGSKKISSQKEVERDLIRGHSSDHSRHQDSPGSGGGSTSHGNLFSEHGSLSRRVGASPGSRLSFRMPSYAILEESVAMRRNYALDLHNSPYLGFQAKSTGGFRHQSLLHGSSMKDQRIPYKHNTAFIPGNWEPSVPFRSLFLSSLTTSSSDVPYDPLRDSIEQSDVGHGSFQHYSYSLNCGQEYQNNLSISGRKSVESLRNYDGDVFYKDFYARDKDVRAAETESVAISATGAENRNSTPGDEQTVVAASVKDVLKATRSVTDGNFMLNSDELRLKELKGEKGRHIHELGEEESKVIKCFRAALIEFVKELMKPVWHEGRLSKDVYKVIVQKAEDKILSTLPSNEVPNTPESIKQYLSSSRPKILKLIQAYVDKYGKF